MPWAGGGTRRLQAFSGVGARFSLLCVTSVTSPPTTRPTPASPPAPPAPAVGIGMLLAFTGLRNLGIVTFDSATLVTLVRVWGGGLHAGCFVPWGQGWARGNGS